MHDLGRPHAHSDYEQSDELWSQDVGFEHGGGLEARDRVRELESIAALAHHGHYG